MTPERIPLAGVVGWPIAHSKSPRIHGYWLKKYGLQGHYVPVGIRLQEFETALRSMPKLGFVGVNVTIPYKETVLAMASSVSDRAALIGAANTISFTADGGIYADNTDGIGFINNLRQEQPVWNPAAGVAVVLGAGGAARAVISSLLNEGAPKVVLANRTRMRAETLQEHFGGRVEVRNWNEAPEIIADAATIVNTTSLGMVGQPKLEFSLKNAAAGSLVTDIVYSPLKTDLLLQAEQRGLMAVDGLGMLLHQAVPGFQQWFGTEPEVDADLRETVLAK
jgi:shikimate dehydrogenase